MNFKNFTNFMNFIELKKITEQVCELSKQTAEFIHEEVDKLRASDIETKSIHNFVTYVDKVSEERLVKGLSKIIPGTGFIAEESPELEMKELMPATSKSGKTGPVSLFLFHLYWG